MKIPIDTEVNESPQYIKNERNMVNNKQSRANLIYRNIYIDS